MNLKKALVITGHIKNSRRHGGFHDFIEFLEDFGYDIDWCTYSMNLTWIIRNDDQNNAFNFYHLWKGIEFEERGSRVRHWGVAVLLPTRLFRYWNKKTYNNHWADWRRVKKRLMPDYDVILVESSACRYMPQLKREYPGAVAIYRPSDILRALNPAGQPDRWEKQAIWASDITLLVDEIQRDYYRKIGADPGKMQIMRNPMVSRGDLEFLGGYEPLVHEEKTAVYIGVSYLDFGMLEYAAGRNPGIKFIICGPFRRRSHANIRYVGSITGAEFGEYLSMADVGIVPNKLNLKETAVAGYPRKVLTYMKYLLPVVATGCSNYLNVRGYLTAECREEFSDLISAAADYTYEQRVGLREGYMGALEYFSKDRVREQLRDIVCNKQEIGK